MKCCIVDANVVGVVFGEDPPPAGVALFRWIQQQEGGLVVGGKLAEELRVESTLKRQPRFGTNSDAKRFADWLRQAWQLGRVKNLDLDAKSYAAIRERTEALDNSGGLRSDDPHMVALAIESGARLLYSHDQRLQQDFRDPSLVNNPRGKVYSSAVSRQLTNEHRRLMREAPTCG